MLRPVTDTGAVIDDALTVFEGTAFEAVREHVRFQPVDLAAYRETFVQMGFVLPASLERLVSERGLLRAPDLGTPFEMPSGSSGFHMADPDELFDGFLHLDDAIDAGVDLARGWLVVAMVSPWRYDGAYAIEEAALESGEPPIGYYTQDGVATGEPTTELPSRFESIDAALTAYGAALRACERRGDRAALTNRLRALSRMAASGEDWKRTWTRVERGKLEWSVDDAREFCVVLAKSDDDAVVAKVLKHIHGELEGHGGRAIDPMLEGIFESGAWPSGFPGPDELLARMPQDGDAGLRRVCHWCLGYSGVTPTESALVEGLAVLEKLAAGEADEAERAGALEACASLASSARGIRIDAGDIEAFYARALTWSLGRLTAARVRSVASIVFRLSRLGHTDEGRAAGLTVPVTVHPFGIPALFQKLSAMVRGRPDDVPDLLRPKVTRPTNLAVHDALRDWFASHEGSQREKLAAVEAEWLPRLKEAADEDRAFALRLVCKKINSKKLKAQRDTLLAPLR